MNASILENMSQGEWLASLDMKNPYFHVPILPAHRPHLRFAFLVTAYQYKVLPFGPAAPRVFTKILSPLFSLNHHQGIRVLPYSDDCLVAAKSKQLLQSHVNTAVQILQTVGFLINWKKSNPNLTQVLVFLGMRIRTDLRSVHIPEERLLNLMQCVELSSLHLGDATFHTEALWQLL